MVPELYERFVEEVRGVLPLVGQRSLPRAESGELVPHSTPTNPRPQTSSADAGRSLTRCDGCELLDRDLSAQPGSTPPPGGTSRIKALQALDCRSENARYFKREPVGRIEPQRSTLFRLRNYVRHYSNHN